MPRPRASLAKPAHRTRARAPRDLLTRLPPDLVVAILDALPPSALSAVPAVSVRWARLFAAESRAEPCFRACVVARFGIRECPGGLSWGQLYLRLRSERCHLCPARDVAPFVYAASLSLSCLPVVDDGVTLFPVCGACFEGILKVGYEYEPLVEKQAARLVFPDVGTAVCDALPVSVGYLYSNTTRFTRKPSPDGEDYINARLLAAKSE